MRVARLRGRDRPPDRSPSRAQDSQRIRGQVAQGQGSAQGEADAGAGVEDATRIDLPLGSICPSWLKLEGGRYVVVKDKAKIVGRIFEWTASGLGNVAVAKRLNRERLPVISGRASAWSSGRGPTPDEPHRDRGIRAAPDRDCRAHREADSRARRPIPAVGLSVVRFDAFVAVDTVSVKIAEFSRPARASQYRLTSRPRTYP